MANANAPFGLRAVRKIDGSVPNYQTIQRQILYTNTTKIFKGDLVKDGGDGYVYQQVYNSTSHDTLGVFDGCEYFDTALSRTVFSPYWTGVSTALSASVFCYVIVDLDLIFEVQSSGAAAVPLSNIMLNATFVATPAGNTTTGISTLALNADTVANTATFPMKIVSLSQRVDNDNTSQYNIVEVILNDAALKTTTGI